MKHLHTLYLQSFVIFRFALSLYQMGSSTGIVFIFQKKFYQFYWSKNNYQIGFLVFSHIVMLLVPPSNTPSYLSFVCPVDKALQQVTITAFVSLFAQFPGMTIGLYLALKLVMSLVSWACRVWDKLPFENTHSSSSSRSQNTAVDTVMYLQVP